jgi:hypothetical protein
MERGSIASMYILNEVGVYTILKFWVFCSQCAMFLQFDDVRFKSAMVDG